MFFNIVPVVFVGGSGGNFISRFISMARDNNQTPAKFSKHGNSHSGRLINFDHIYSKISHICEDVIPLIKKERYLPLDKTFYPSLHVGDVNVVPTIFNRAIKITFDQNYQQEVALVYVLKEEVDRQNKTFTIEKVNARIRFVEKYNRLYNCCAAIDHPNVFNIDWTEIMYGNPQLFIEKLAEFTQIPFENFNLTNLLTWQNMTTSTIKQYLSEYCFPLTHEISAF
jgi:hypothetical protein